MSTGTRWGLTMVSAILVGLALVALYGGLLALTTGALVPWGSRFRTNGERIYATATSDSGQPIVAEMGSMVMVTPGVTCADCHGADGRGGTVRMMMGAFQTPDIRYPSLTGAAHEGAHEEHPPYNDALLKQAITQGLDPAGEPLAWPMPRWRMSEDDLNDLAAFLKTLK